MSSTRQRHETLPEAPARTWRGAAGAWLGIGTAPGALVLGAQIGGRHDGALPVLVLLVGGAVMTWLLAAQGRFGLRPPVGENAALAEIAPRYLPSAAERAFTALLAAAMVGWFGFNVGLGGGATAALIGLPDAAGVALLTVPTVAVLLAGAGRWNAVAVVTTITAIALIAVVAVRLAPSRSPVAFTPSAGPAELTGLAGDLAGYIGYVAVFAVRAPDFTVGLRGRADLARCVALLVVPALAASIVGAGVAARYPQRSEECRAVPAGGPGGSPLLCDTASGSTDVVAVLAGPEGLPVANLFVAIAVVAPTLAAVHSGVFAVRRFAVRLPHTAAVLAIALPGTVLAALRVDRLMLDWLTLLAAALPALIPPMAAEAARRRRGRPARPVPTLLWAPAAAFALALTVAGVAAAAPAGLAISALATLVHHVVVTRHLVIRKKGP